MTYKFSKFPKPGRKMLKELIKYVGPAIGVALATVIGYAIYALKNFLQAKADETDDLDYQGNMHMLRETLRNAALQAVKTVEQTFVEDAKKSNNGKLPDKEKTNALNKAVNIVQAHLTQDELTDLQDEFADLTETVKNFIEEAIYNNKKAG